MPLLVLFRHAKAEPKAAGGTDFDRPLAPRGEIDARTMGRRLAEFAAPALVLCSPALRTKQTWEIASQAFDAGARLAYDERLYEASVADIFTCIRECGPAGTVFVIGHNPGLEDLAPYLLEPDDRTVWRTRVGAMGTANIAILHSGPEDWMDLEAGTLGLDRVLAPDRA